MLHDAVDVEIRVFDHGRCGIDHLAKAMRWNVGRHTHCNASRTVDQQVGHPGRHDQRFILCLIVIGTKINGFPVEVRQDFVRQLRHAHFRVTHGRRCVSINRTKIALAIHQQVAHGEWLGHADDRVIDRGIAMGVILTNDVTHHAGRFLIGLIPVVAQFAHGEKNSAMDRFQPVAHIGKSTSDDHAHGVVQIGLAHFVFEVDLQYFFGKFGH